MRRNRRGALGIAWLLSTFAAVGAAAQTPQADPLKENRTGVTVHESAAFAGYTLVAPMNSTSTYLIDLEGRIVKEWKSDYTPALSAYLLENGDLLRPGAERGPNSNAPGAGGRIQRISWEGELVWDYSFGDSRWLPHHDLCPLPNGNVLVVATDPKSKDEAIAAGRQPDKVRSQLLPDCILEIKPTGPTSGEIVWQWHAWDHLVQDYDPEKPQFGEVSDHPELIDVNFNNERMDRMMRDPQQLARLRSLGYVGGGGPPGGQGSPDLQGDRRPDGNRVNRDRPGGDRPDGLRPEGDRPDASRADGARPDGPPSATPPAGGGQGPGRGGPRDGDWMHVNSIAYNPTLDQIIISVHEFNEVWVLDHSTTPAEAASHAGGRSGKGGDLLYRWGNPKAYRNGSNADQRLFAQHCAHWIADGLPGAGHLMVFNNGNERPGGPYSSVDEFVPPVDGLGHYTSDEGLAFGPSDAVWSYAAPNRESFFSMLISGAQRMPNGNTLICSGNQALLFEVTADGEIVWLYRHPGGGMGGGMGGGVAMPRPGEVLPVMLRQMLEVTDEQNGKLDQLQVDVDARLEKILTDEQKRRLDDLRSGSRMGGGPGPQGFAAPQGAPPPQGGVPGAAQDRGGPGDARMRGGPGGRGPGGPGGPGGFFRCYRYAADYPGLAGRELVPGKKLDEVSAAAGPPRRPDNARRN